MPRHPCVVRPPHGNRFAMRACAVVALLAVVLVPARGHANDIDLELAAKVLAGQGEPAVTLKVQRPTVSLHLVLTRDDGAVIDKSFGKSKAGATVRVPLGTREGTSHFA